MPRTSKSFELPNFLASRSHVRIVQVVETEKHIFLGKWIVTLSHAAHIKLGATVLVESHHFSLLPSHSPLPLLSTTCCTIFTPRISLIKYIGYCLTFVVASGCSTMMIVLTTTLVVATYNSSASSGLGGTRVGRDLCKDWWPKRGGRWIELSFSFQDFNAEFKQI
jgi:hypothetical protein